MSAPICLRSAFGACRPSRTVRLPLRPAFVQVHTRNYADQSSSKKQDAPKPVAKEEQKNVTNEVPKSATSVQSNTLPSPQSVARRGSNVADKDEAREEKEGEGEDEVNTRLMQTEPPTPRTLLPANVIAAYRAPMKHPATYGIPVASLQLRSFSVRSLEFFSDFALRAAYYLNLPATGPVPLPKRIERWTVPRSNFVHKKSQENFERITMKRLITIYDGEKSAVEIWLAILRKQQFWGVGMKANVWEFEGLDVASKMDAQSKEIQKDVEAKLANFGWSKSVADKKSLDEMLFKQGVKHAGVPMMEVRRALKPEEYEVKA